MFKGMSENDDRGRGKFAGATSLDGKATHWELGSEPHEPAQTVTARDFAGFANQKLERTRPIP